MLIMIKGCLTFDYRTTLSYFPVLYMDYLLPS